MAYELEKRVHVDLRHEGKDYSGDFGPGIVDLPQPVADLLTANGLAKKATATKKAAKPNPTDESLEA